MTMKTSLIITGDSKVAVGAVDALKDSVDKLNATAQANAPATAQMDAAVGAIADTAKDAAGAVGTLDGAIGAIGASSGAATGNAAALGDALGQVSDGVRGVQKDADALDNVLSGITGAIGDTVTGAIGLDGALKDVGGASRETSDLAGALEGELGKLAQGAVASATAQKGIAAASGVASTAMAGLGVTATAVEAILTGGLSLALTAAIGFLSGFAAEALTGAGALDTEGAAAASAAEQIDALNDALAREIKTQYASELAALANAQAHRTLAIEAVKAREALLGTAVAEAEKRRGSVKMTARGDVIDPGFVSATREVDRLKEEVRVARADLAAKEKEVVAKTRPFVDRGIAAATDPRKGIALTYDQKLARLDVRREQMGETAYARERIKLDQQRATATDALSASERAAAASGRSLNATRSAGGAIDRAAGESQRQLMADLQGVIGRYDPAAKAASDYADELERIARLEAAGKIGADDAANYRKDASAAYLGKTIDLSGVKDMAAQEQGAIDAAGAIDKLVASIGEEAAALTALDPIQRTMIRYRKELAALPEGERAAAAQRIASAEAELDANKAVADAAEDAHRAQVQLGQTAVDAFTAIVVGGQKASDVIGRLAQSIASAAIEATLFGTGPMAALLGGAVAPSGGNGGGAAQSAASDVASKSIAKSISGSIETSMDKVFGSKGSFGTTLKNAGLGYAAGGITGSRTGGAVGGAIGGAVGKELLGSALGKLGQFAGPIGAIAGGLLGGAIGGLLKKTKSGAANITGVDSDATLSGNSSSFKKAAAGAAGDVQDGLSSIAEQLGGSIGSFNVTIGQRHDDWRVRSGAGSLKIAAGAKEFDDDEAGAKAYAMQLAISQGAVKGLSAAVEKALKSSADIDDAMAEALKVQEIETLMGGIGAQLASEFKAFEAQAKERLRIASEYGFDVVAIEKKNAEDRVALSERLLEEQVGSLQRLVDEMTSGSLFEGSAIEQRNAILKEIDQAKVDLAAGKDGAGDKLATLLQNLNSVSEDAFGSTAQYAADRAMIQDEARAAIAAANAQIREAASKTASDPALTATNQALDENNDQNAQIISLLQTMIDRGQIIATSGTLDAASLARTS